MFQTIEGIVMVNEEEIRILQNFRKMLDDYFNGYYEDEHKNELNSAINKILKIFIQS